VALAGFYGWLVQVQHNGHAREKEQQEQHPTVFFVSSDLEEQARYAQKQRQQKKLVTGFALGHGSRYVQLFFPGPQDPRVRHITLPANEIPPEISPVHVVELVIPQKLQVLPEAG